MKVSLKEIVSKNVKAIRKSKGMSQQDLADETGLSVRYLSKVENDPPDITLGNLERISRGLGVMPSELLGSVSCGRSMSVEQSKAIQTTIRIMQALLETD